MMNTVKNGTRPIQKNQVRRINWLRWIVGISTGLFLLYRIILMVIRPTYGPVYWLGFLNTGLIVGGMYSLIAIGYTLVYGVMSLINFAHGDIMMLGCFAGFFTFEFLNYLPSGDSSFLNNHPILSILFAFIMGTGVSMLSGYFLEKLAYRPLRNSKIRLAPLISAVGASIFLETSAQILFGATKKTYKNPDLLARGSGWNIQMDGGMIVITKTGVFSLLMAIILMIALYLFVQKTKLGKSIRAVSQDKMTAQLMGINLDRVTSQTFLISGFLAGASGVMWGIHNGLFNHYVGFLPGIKAFTAAVLGGIGNIPGAMVGGMVLGIVESVGPAFLGIDFQLKDVIAFAILILVLILKPSGLFGKSSGSVEKV
jgi:branched-chain amino acid transport system permease protein